MVSRTLLDYLWVITASGLVFFMQPGFAMLESGLTRSKNSINVAIKNLTDLGVSLLTFWAFGFAIMFGASWSGLFGQTGFLLSFSGNGAVWVAVFFLFQSMFCSTSATIVSGAVAERMRYSSYLLCTFVLSGLVYPVFGHWAWGGVGNMAWDKAPGWLASIGFVDFAGSSVVHSVGGWTSLAAILVVGSRTGRFAKGEKPKTIQGNDIPGSVLGVFILWFGWIGFNGGSTLAMNDQVPGIIVRTCLAAASGMITTLLAGWALKKLPDVGFVINGSLAGLVAITAPCHCVNEWQSLAIGAAGGLVFLCLEKLLEVLRIDDAVGAVPVHLGAGVWGTLSVGIFGDPAILGNHPLLGSQLLAQAVGVGACAVWAFGVSFILFKLLDRFSPLRVKPEEEQVGLNVSEHGASTELHDLFSVMETQSRTGDLSLRLPVEPFTEVGQIAAHYNRAMEGFEKNLVARSDYEAILDNVTDGLLLVDRDYRIHSHHSKAAGRLFGRDSLGGEDFRELLKPQLPEKLYATALEYLDLLFDPKMKMRSLAELNPLKEAEFFADTGEGRFESRFLRLDFSRIGYSGKVNKLMVVARDLTAQVQARREAESERRRSQGEMELFYKILHIDPELFGEFVDSMQEDLDDMNAALESDRADYRERLERIFRRTHSIKGNAALLELDFIAEAAHDFETEVQALRAKADLEAPDFLPLAVRLSSFYATLGQVRRLTERLAAFRSELAGAGSADGELVALSLKRLVESASADLGKKATLDYGRFSARSLPARMKKKVKDVLVQLARNSVAHGIERPEARRAAGKAEEGLIEISLKREADFLSVTLRDDGAGLDFRGLAKAAGLEAGAAKEEIFAAALRGGTSTADESVRGPHAGRGVGLSLVKSVVEELRGSLRVRSKKGSFAEFTLRVPLGGASS